MKKFTLITAAFAALALISCQKEQVNPQPIPQEDVWEIEIEGQTTKADITKTMILIVKPNESIEATLKKNGSEYKDHEDVTWSWTGGNVKATRIGDGSKKGVSTCSLTANSSGSETVYVTASVGSAPGANIPTKSANVVVNEPEAVIKVTQEYLPTPYSNAHVGDRLVLSLDFNSGIQGFSYDGGNVSITCSAETVLLENIVDKYNCPDKPNTHWQDGGDTWIWQHNVSNIVTVTLNKDNVAYCDLDWTDGCTTGNGPRPYGAWKCPYPASGSTWGRFTLSGNIDHIEDAVYNQTSSYEHAPRY